ncbi:MAG: efflux RND transporter permease subunit [Saprospirales bacterium]|nr:MAG: efflux RND transporter permease subunit [Saprospirales bacterium]
MSLSSISIQRPVLTIVMSIVIVLFGIIGYTELGLREYPSVDPPIITVVTDYPGANADVIEAQVTEPLEENVNGIAGIREMSSVSADGRSTITVEFDLSIDLEAAANDVRDRVSRAIRSLPPDIEPPTVRKADADATTILVLTVQSDRRDLMQLTAFADDILKERLQTIPGISLIRIWGSKRYSMRLNLDPAKMTAMGVSPLDVRNALNRENVELPSGNIEGYRTELTIRTFGRMTTADEFRDLIIREDNGALVRLKDIGEAKLAPQNMRTLLRGNNKIPMVGLAVTPQPGSNHIEIADEFYERVRIIERELPEDIQLGYAIDTTTPIRTAITEVQSTIFLAFVLVILVIFFFLRDWRTTLIPVVAMPISLIGAFFVMYLFGFTINVLTLLGIVLATGLVVDDAIVMLENIYQKIEQGMTPIQAGIAGAKEIYFAIIVTTVSLVAVFMPIIFLEGAVGRLFQEFGMVLAGAVIISTFVSLSMTPMLASRILKKRDKQSFLYQTTEPFFKALINGYRRTLSAFLKVAWVAPIFVILAAGGIYFLLETLPSELAPMEDKSRFRVISSAPEGTSYELMDEYVMSLLEFIDTIPEKTSIIAVTSPGFGATTSVNSSFIRIALKDPEKRDRSQQEIVNSLQPKLSQHNFARSFAAQDQTIQVGRNLTGLPVQYVIQAPNLERMREKLPEFTARANEHGAFNVVDVDLKFTKPEINVTIDRIRANALGVSVRDIAETLQLFFASQRYGFFIMDGKQYEVIGEAIRTSRNEPIDLKQANVRNRHGQLIPLENLVHLEERSSPPQLFRYNRYVSATVSAGLNDGYTLGQGIGAMDEIADEILDDSFFTTLTGPSRDFTDSATGLYFAFILALVLVFLTLAAQFESFVDPFVIMFTVPLALVGALLSLYIFGHTMNIFSQIGMIVLVGIVTKNGILIVEFANQKLPSSATLKEAALEAATLRFRPIVMTSLATSLATLPIALALGAAATSRIPMGIVVVGGLLFSLILTLYIIPAMYALLSRKKNQLNKQLVTEN